LTDESYHYAILGLLLWYIGLVVSNVPGGSYDR